jgi:putative transposase
MSLRLVEQLQQKAVPVNQLCRVLAVSRSGIRGQQAQSRPACDMPSQRAIEGRVCGQRRGLWQPPLAHGHGIARHCDWHLPLAPADAQARTALGMKRKFVHTTDSKHSLPISANVLMRKFNPARPNQAWVADITYI